MISLSEGIRYAVYAFIIALYFGFFIRLVVYEKIVNPVAISFSTLLFTGQMFILLGMPFFSFLIAAFDEDIRKESRIKGWRRFVSYMIVLILSPFIGLKFIFVKTPVVYNEFFKALHTILFDMKEAQSHYRHTRSSLLEYIKFQLKTPLNYK